MPPNWTGPLDGVVVLDLCSYLAGPYGCTLLADLGATVIKIEPPQGDMLRQFPSSLPGESRFFLGANRGKRAISLDLKEPEGLAVLHRMAGTADVFVENFRPSVPARLGIDYPPPQPATRPAGAAGRGAGAKGIVVCHRRAGGLGPSAAVLQHRHQPLRRPKLPTTDPAAAPIIAARNGACGGSLRRAGKHPDHRANDGCRYAAVAFGFIQAGRPGRLEVHGILGLRRRDAPKLRLHLVATKHKKTRYFIFALCVWICR